MNYIYLGIIASLLSASVPQVPAQIASAFCGSTAPTRPCERTASASAAGRHAATLDPAGLGIVKCAGGTESVTFDAGSIDYSQDPNIAGTLQNSMGSLITNCTVKIKPVGTQGQSPTSGTVKIHGVQQKFKDGSALLTGLSIPSGADAIPIRIKLDSTRNPCEEFTLTFQASVSVAPAASLHQDALGQYLFSETQCSITRKILEPGNAGVHGVAKHSDTADPEADLIALSGSVSFDSSDSLSIAGVFLRNISGGTISSVPGAKVTTKGKSFSITNFKLAPGEKYHVVVLFSGTPTKAVELKLNAAFNSD